MKIGILVEGDSEYYALPRLLGRIPTSDDLRLRPQKCSVHPLAPPGQIALRAARDARMLTDRGAEHIVILLDLETRNVCPAEFAAELAAQVHASLVQSSASSRVSVVMKVRTFENWLISDPQAISANPGLFDPPQRFARHVSPDKADNVDALQLLQQWSRVRGAYEKVKGAAALCEKLDPERAARNSRSFRRLLRVLGNPQYQSQSRQPA